MINIEFLSFRFILVLIVLPRLITINKNFRVSISLPFVYSVLLYSGVLLSEWRVSEWRVSLSFWYVVI